MAGKSTATDIAAQEAEIIARLDIMAEYRAMGVVFCSEQPRGSGKIECYSAFREEAKPSGYVDCDTGQYGDSASGERAISLWEFAARKGVAPDWRQAREHFASKAGVKLSTRKKKDNPLDVLEFLAWHEGHDRLAARWCREFKQGASLEAIKLCGGRIVQYPCWNDPKTGERKKGEYKCIALPCWSHHLPPAPPVAWVIWNISGKDLPVRRGKDLPPEMVKMKSVGPTAGTMMGLQALESLASPTKSSEVELIYKTAGPSDLLAVVAAILRDAPELAPKHLVLANAAGETSDVMPHQVALFAGRSVVVIGDADEAGEFGVLKWQQAILPVCASLKCPRLPYAVQKKHGKDLRDFLNGLPAEAMSHATN